MISSVLLSGWVATFSCAAVAAAFRGAMTSLARRHGQPAFATRKS